ncbi:MAG TPA: DUF3231 family protein [Bacillales bacterium]|nr:DUF3231 family protein [Bacillales bacterium]
MSKNHVARLNGAELGNIWTSYMSDSMAVCVLTRFSETAEDPEVRNILQFALDLSKKHIGVLKEIFQRENCPIPVGFEEKDMNLNAPRLFSDTFFLVYLQNMSRMGLGIYSIALPIMAREDVRDYYRKCVASSADLNVKLTKLMLKKGIYTRAPYVTVPNQVAFINDQHYKAGWLGKQRPLTSQEMTNVSLSLLTNVFSKVLLSGYAQVAKVEKVRRYMFKGANIAAKQIEILSGLLHESDLSAPPTWDSEVTESTVAPFSDKLMMFHSRVLTQAGIANYGGSISMSMRHDLAPIYTKMAAELGKFGDKGLSLMIENRWLEEPPRAPDRTALTKKGQDHSRDS